MAIEKSPLNVVLGAAAVGDTSTDPFARFNTPDEVNGFLEVFARHGHRQIDTSRMYSPENPGSSEIRLGAVSAGQKFDIDTKVFSFGAGCHKKENVLRDVDASLESLKIQQVNIEYLHLPDRTTPFEEACEAMNEAFKAGKLKRWGLSNYPAQEVQQILDICEERGYVKPSVYQGHYNVIVRGGEAELFPLLRKNNIAFYAYSPATGGFFAGNHKNLKSGGRFDPSHGPGSRYADLYIKPAITAATDRAVEVASKHGIGGHGAALRWTVYHSLLSKEHGDAVIVGASSSEQLEANLDMIEQGPLPDELVAALEAVYAEVGPAIVYHL